MEYIADAFTNIEIGIILIDIFDRREAFELDLDPVLTVTTEIAMDSVAVYSIEQIWRVSVDINRPLGELALVLLALTLTVDLPEDLRGFAVGALRRKFPELPANDQCRRLMASEIEVLEREE